MKKILTIGSGDAAAGLCKIISQVPVVVQAVSMPKAVEALNGEEHFDLLVLDTDREGISDKLFPVPLVTPLEKWRGRFMVVSSRRDAQAPIEALHKGAIDYIAKPYNTRELLTHVNAALQEKKRIVCLGGGTGLFTVLMGLKTLPGIFLNSIVSMSDSGGSSGKLRSTFGMLPPGDIRRSLVALSNAPELMNKVIQYRFERGGEFKDHSFGNLFLTALMEITGSMSEAVRALADLLNIQGIVIPASGSMTDLVARFEDGTVVRGESKIDLCENRSPELRITELTHEPEAECNTDAYSAIMFADYITMGPGDLYTSVIANLSIDGIRQALQKTAAKKIYIVNVMTKAGETTHYSALDHVKEIVKYLGGDYLDYVFVSSTALSSERTREYEKKGQELIQSESLDEFRTVTQAQIVDSDLVHETDLVRHDSEKIKREFFKIIQKHEKKTVVTIAGKAHE